MRTFTIAVAAASFGLIATAASAQTVYGSVYGTDDGRLLSGRSVGSTVEFDGYRAHFGSGGRSVYPGAQTRTGGPSGEPNQNGG